MSINKHDLRINYEEETGKPAAWRSGSLTPRYTKWMEEKLVTILNADTKEAIEKIKSAPTVIIKPMDIKRVVFDYYLNNGYLDNSEFYPDETLLFQTYGSRMRWQPFPFMRFTTMYFIRKTNKRISLKQVGTVFSTGRDHSSVLHGISTYEDIVQTDKLEFKKHLDLCDLLNVENTIVPSFSL